MRTSLSLLLGLTVSAAMAQQPQSSSSSPSPAAAPKAQEQATLPPEVRPVPPPGIEVPQADRDELRKQVDALQKLIEEARKAQAKNPQLDDLLPDLLIFHKAVDWALKYNEFFKPDHIKSAYAQVEEGRKRAEAFKKGETPWLYEKGFVVRAYKSKIDGSIQPYGMSIPQSYAGAKTRLDVWLRGRAEKATELGFVDDRMKRSGHANPDHVLVLHPYGRYCCANKFAGETDFFEAYAHASKFYNFDENRMNIRGFSMGGAATWQFATHYPYLWSAATPGAGFSETPEFLKMTPEQLAEVPWYQKKLWHLYNASDYALNIANLPTVAYSGEIDGQKQAADVMTREMKKENLELTHLIGPQTAHKIHPDSLIEIESRLTDINAKGRDRAPARLHFTTWTLRYNKSHWITLDGLKQHWERARVDAAIKDDSTLEIKTSNITALTVNFASGQSPLNVLTPVTVVLDGQTIATESRTASDLSWHASFQQKDGKWQMSKATATTSSEGLRKVHALQGPVDDAFWNAFVFVTPTGKAATEQAGAWVKSEMERALREWTRQFRGDTPKVKDVELKPEEVQDKNLVLWGDPSSNTVLKRMADKLPIKWTASGLEVNGKSYALDQHVPIFIFPNPENPARYVVINSGFTYREEDYLNNARQVPKLPDWAVVNLSEKPDAVKVGKVVDAGFFDEEWKFKPTTKTTAAATVKP